MPADSRAKQHFYEVLNIPTEPDPFVAEHVLPKLERCASGETRFNDLLSEYLLKYYDATVIADWPRGLRASLQPAHVQGQRAGMGAASHDHDEARQQPRTQPRQSTQRAE